jgi:hypothetical protein
MKTAYTATFSNGKTITRKSDREYGAAFLWEGFDANGTFHTRSGFSSSRASATKALEGQCGWIRAKGGLAFAEVVSVSRPGPVLLDDVLSGKGGAA